MADSSDTVSPSEETLTTHESAVSAVEGSHIGDTTADVQEPAKMKPTLSFNDDEAIDHPTELTTPPVSPYIQRRRERSGSVASRVTIDHFDPEGVAALQRALTRLNMDEAQAPPLRSMPPSSILPSASTASTDATLVADEALFDFETTLQRAIQKSDEATNARQLGVCFQDLRVVGLGASAEYQATFASALDPRSMVNKIKELRHPPVRDILSGFEGVVRPGEMLLVLGNPGSGCSTLLKILANRRREYHAVHGAVHYDAFSSNDIARQFRGDVRYVPEDDEHFPTLTVDQTLRFAATMRAPRTRIDGQSRAEYIDLMTEVLETVFGLRHAKHTLIGDQRIRGISGGEKKRVSIAEALITRALLGCWDNSTRGLDASTALEFVRALRIATDLARLTTIASLYQAGEQLYECFDTVCVLYAGRMAYFGPASEARQHFIDMGYEPLNRQTTADFLVAVTDPMARKIRPGLSVPVPQSAAEFAEHFKRSALGQKNAEDVRLYRADFASPAEHTSAYMASARAERTRWTRRSSPYTISVWRQAHAAMRRRVQILRGAPLPLIVNMATYVVQATIVGTVFKALPAETSAMYSRSGALFFSILFSALLTMAEIPGLFGQRPIVLRHYDAGLYHPFVQALALTVVDLPISISITAAFSIILYFTTGLQRSVTQFFVFYLFVMIMTVTMKAWFRMLAAATKSVAPAQTLGGVTMLILTLYTGYTIPRPDMLDALRWLTWINPLRYGFEGLLVNEFHTLQASCATMVPQGPGYENVTIANQVCATVGSQPGKPFVDGSAFVQLAYGYSYSDMWRNLGIVATFCVGFVCLLLMFTEFNTGSAGESRVTLFKRGSKSSDVQQAVAAAADDEEKVSLEDLSLAATLESQAGEKAAEHQKMVDVFSWQHLNYTVSLASGQRRQLLCDISGYVVPGKLTALMGESGAGKTTLLNVLADRRDVGVVTGDRFVNGQALPVDFQAQTGYCQQMDTHIGSTTVREALLFSAKMRQPQSVPLAEKEAYVQTCLKMCGMENYADAIVGSLGVEHRKRTTIGVELAAKPKLLLFLDEPTSGLDSQSAWAIMQFLRTLADSGTAILCTIHQPSAELFQQFDRMLLLKKGGKTVYFGDVGEKATTLIRYFESNGARAIRPGENPAEYMLDVIGAGATAKSTIEWFDVWNGSKEINGMHAEIETIHEQGRGRPPVQASLQSEFATSWSYQVATLFRRNAISFWRNPTYLVAKIALNIMGALLNGFTFYQSKDTQQGTQDKLFACFMATIVSVALANQLMVPFLITRNVYEIRERPSRMYSWSALITSQLLVEIPWNVLGSSLFFCVWFWTVGFETSRAGYTYLMVGICFPLYYTTVGQAIASMSPGPEIAAMLFGFLFSFVLIFNGVLQPFRSLGFWRWMYRLSPYTYLIEGLVGQAVGQQDINCSAIELSHLTPPAGQTCAQYMQAYISFAGGYLVDPNATSDCQFCSTRTTDQFLSAHFSIYYSHRWRNTAIFLAFIGFNITAIYVFTYLFRIRKGSLLAALKRRLARRSE